MESYEHSGGSVGNDDGMLEELTDTHYGDHSGDIPTESDADEVREWIKDNKKYNDRLKKKSRNNILGIMFLKKVD